MITRQKQEPDPSDSLRTNIGLILNISLLDFVDKIDTITEKAISQALIVYRT